MGDTRNLETKKPLRAFIGKGSGRSGENTCENTYRLEAGEYMRRIHAANTPTQTCPYRTTAYA